MVSCTDNGRAKLQYIAGGESRKSFWGARRVYIIASTESYFIDRLKNRIKYRSTGSETVTVVSGPKVRSLKTCSVLLLFFKLYSKHGALKKPEASDGLKVWKWKMSSLSFPSSTLLCPTILQCTNYSNPSLLVLMCLGEWACLKYIIMILWKRFQWTMWNKRSPSGFSPVIRDYFIGGCGFGVVVDQKLLE